MLLNNGGPILLKTDSYWGESVEDAAEQFALLATNEHNLVDAEHPIEGKAPIKEHFRLFPHGFTPVPGMIGESIPFLVEIG